jgi:hypothetical protein
MLRAKFRCDEVTKTKSNDGKFLYTAKFSAVHSGSDENKNFFEYTPYGNLQLGTYKEDYFEPGKEYYLDFIEAK